MDEIESVVCLLLCLWLFVTHQAQERQRRQRRLEEARRNTREKYRRLREAMMQFYAEDELRPTRRMMRALMWRNSLRKPSVRTFNRASSEWWDAIVPAFTSAQWLQNFRMSQEMFSSLCGKLRPAMKRQHTTFRESVPVKKRVAIALWKLANGAEDRSTGRLFGVSIATVCRCVQEFCAAAVTLLAPEQIRFPDEARFGEMAGYIENRWGLPNCVGAIHSSHIPIIAPQQYHTDYFNHEGSHSIILQGVVDGKGLFWDVFAGLPGRLHDAHVLRLSPLWELANRGNLFPAQVKSIGSTMTTDYYILGDSAYPMQNWLLTPFQDSGRLTPQQQAFNQNVSRTRVAVENAFVRLKGRWRCLLERNDCDLELVKSMVLTCCALHNLCESSGEPYDASWDLPAAATPQPVMALAQGVEEEEGREVQEALMQ